MASHLPRMNSSNKGQELIDFDLNQGGLDYKLCPCAQPQDLLWLNVKNLYPQYTAPREEMKKDRRRRKKSSEANSSRDW